ncbi:MAG TPA: hypothetical protein VK126_05975 [Nitrososphaerales archaeon]|nr:hypothetical protein [Nitrososphaerales archaeon]
MVRQTGDLVSCQVCGSSGYPVDFDGGVINKDVILTSTRCSECGHLSIFTDQWYHLFETDCNCECNLVLKGANKQSRPWIEPKNPIR